MKTVIVNQFNGGITNDPRAEGNVCRVVSNFDALTNSHKLTPYRDTENGDGGSSTSQKQNFTIALRTGTTYSLYGLGRQSALDKPEVLYKDLTTGGANDLDDTGWSTPSNNQSGTASPSYALFTYYKKTGLIYGAAGGNRIWAFSPTGSAWDDNIISTNGGSPPSYTTIAEGLVHSKDDILYIPYDNKIMKNNNGTWTITALTLPSHLYITAIAEHGDYLAIACAPLNGLGHSRVFLWNRDETTTTLSESIDFGPGLLKILQVVSGRLVGVSIYGNNSTRFADRVVFKQYDGVGFTPFLTLEGGTATQLPQAKQVIDDRLWFMMAISLNGSVRWGTWSIGIQGDRWALIHEQTGDNDVAFSSGNHNLKGFIKVGDYLFQSFVDASGNYALNKTNDTNSYTATAIYESKINPNMPLQDRFKKKQLGALAVFFEKLSSGQQVVLKTRVDGGSFSSAHFTKTLTAPDTDLIGYEFEPSGQIAPGREFEFRIESTGGAVITAFAYNYDDTMKSSLFL